MSSYPKLTDKVVDIILLELSSRVDVREICKVVGISHTTYYRWLRVGRSLFGKRGLTETEKRLRALARGVEKRMREYSVPAEASVSNFVLLETSSLSPKVRLVTDEHCKHRSETDGADVLGIEQLTDDLTGGVRCVEFKSEDSLKSM